MCRPLGTFRMDFARPLDHATRPVHASSEQIPGSPPIAPASSASLSHQREGACRRAGPSFFASRRGAAREISSRRSPLLRARSAPQHGGHRHRLWQPQLRARAGRARGRESAPERELAAAELVRARRAPRARRARALSARNPRAYTCLTSHPADTHPAPALALALARASRSSLVSFQGGQRFLGESATPLVRAPASEFRPRDAAAAAERDAALSLCRASPRARALVRAGAQQL